MDYFAWAKRKIDSYELLVSNVAWLLTDLRDGYGINGVIDAERDDCIEIDFGKSCWVCIYTDGSAAFFSHSNAHTGSYQISEVRDLVVKAAIKNGGAKE